MKRTYLFYYWLFTVLFNSLVHPGIPIEDILNLSGLLCLIIFLILKFSKWYQKKQKEQ